MNHDSTFEPEKLDCPYFGKCQMKRQEVMQESMQDELRRVTLRAQRRTFVFCVVTILVCIASLVIDHFI